MPDFHIFIFFFLAIFFVYFLVWNVFCLFVCIGKGPKRTRYGNKNTNLGCNRSKTKNSKENGSNSTNNGTTRGSNNSNNNTNNNCGEDCDMEPLSSLMCNENVGDSIGMEDNDTIESKQQTTARISFELSDNDANWSDMNINNENDEYNSTGFAFTPLNRNGYDDSSPANLFYNVLRFWHENDESMEEQYLFAPGIPTPPIPILREYDTSDTENYVCFVFVLLFFCF